MNSLLAIHFFISLTLPLYLSYSGYIKKKLSFSGALAAFLIGFINIQASYYYGIILLSFYYTSSLLTKYGNKTKLTIELHHKEFGQRNYVQVFANSILATLLLLIKQTFIWDHLFENINNIHSNYSILFECLFIAHYACANGDTWASEIGVLSSSKPFLVTSFKRVPTGTNGGITPLGLAASAAGGLFIGNTHLYTLMLLCTRVYACFTS